MRLTAMARSRYCKANGLNRMSILGPMTTRAFWLRPYGCCASGFAAGATTLFLGETYPGGWSPQPCD